MRYWMFAQAGDGAMTRNITVTSIANNQQEVSEKTLSANGAISSPAAMFKNAKRPAPVIFTWKPDSNGAPKSLFAPLFDRGEFALELRIVDSNSRASFHFNFYRCKLFRSQPTRDGQIKIEATYMFFG
ncbi:MAG: hypothetical protein IT173_11195 [Acidobacteria bacterium]|nr:hypothetical protein [Acidobacteriota bacterium]